MVLLINPIDLQREMFGKVVAYPSQYKEVATYLSEDGVTRFWAYTSPIAPRPVAACKFDKASAPPRAVGAPYRCFIEHELSDPVAYWREGRLVVGEIARHRVSTEEPIAP